MGNIQWFKKDRSCFKDIVSNNHNNKFGFFFDSDLICFELKETRQQL